MSVISETYNRVHNILEDFLCFTKFSLPYKCNNAWLFVIKMLYKLPHELLNDLRLITYLQTRT